jgi:hypothetical protein
MMQMHATDLQFFEGVSTRGFDVLWRKVRYPQFGRHPQRRSSVARGQLVPRHGVSDSGLVAVERGAIEVANTSSECFFNSVANLTRLHRAVASAESH